MIHVTVPSFRQVSEDDEKPYTVYQINVLVGGRTHILEKRYREFHALHKQLKKTIETPEFPPKKVRQLSNKGLEQRRTLLECYIQGILDRELVPRSLLTFLRVKNFKTASYDSLDDIDQEPVSTHQPTMVFETDPFLRLAMDVGLHDTVVEGVRQGLYEDDFSLPLT
ncbi:sorting nexin-24-like [Anneissia japonica]|uniref:sorting nexin-24-like n=1 Tax=Anneissia japonica TaxID=1529436 RepID=UPI0014256734|nr:sorting nexin-24-like [Anneissia japonica]